MPQTNFIYALVDPRNNAVRYVGKSNEPKARFFIHMHYECSNGHKQNWLNQLKRLGLLPVMEIIEECGEDWADRERYWISYHRRTGAKLTNLTDGGEGLVGYSHSPEIRERISAGMRKALEDPETRARFDELMSSEQYKESCAAARKAFWADPEARARNMKGLNSPEHRANQSAISKKRWEDPEYRAKWAAGMAKAWEDPEVRKRRSDGLKAGWVKRHAREAAEREQRC
jgi:hypothetical protein